MQMTEKITPRIDPARNMLEIITTLLDKLRPSDRKAAELVLADPRFVLDATLATTARRAGVSEPTEIRFCEAVGCAGFQDFKLRLAQSIALGMPATHSVRKHDASISSALERPASSR